MKLTKGKVTYALPTEKSKPVTSIGGYTMLLYGEKKIGKTSLCSHFPKALFCMFEPGGKALSIYQEPMTSWLKFKRFVELICKTTQFETIVIDTADYAYDDCADYVCKNLGVSHPSEEAYGKGWNAIRKEFTLEIRKLLKSGKGVIFISHQKLEKIEERSGRSYDRKTNTLSGQARDILEGLVDIWANYDYTGTTRNLTILGDDFIDAGHRLTENFNYSNGEPIRVISMGKSSKDAYNNFVSAFNNNIVQRQQEGGLNAKSSLVTRKKISSKLSAKNSERLI